MTATRGTATPATAPDDAGLRGIWLWDVLFGTVTVATSVLIVLDEQLGGRSLGAVAIVVACWLAWVFHGRRTALDGTAGARPATLAYGGALTFGLVGAVLLAPAANWAAIVVLSQLYWLLTLPIATVGTVLLALVLPIGAEALRSGDMSLEHATSFCLPAALFMTLFGVLAGIYIHRVSDQSEERARLIAELERTRAEVAELSHRSGVAAERERLAGEIHDTLAQGFTSIVTLLQAAQAEFDTDSPAARRHVALAVRAAKENLQEARQVVAAAAPGELTGGSLPDAVGRQVERFAEETGTDAAFGASGAGRRLPAEHEVVLLRAAQELLANVRRHAGATTVTVRLDFGPPDVPGTVTLTVADDGAGFVPEKVGGGSYGLAMMRVRVGRLGGTLELDTAPGAGTTVTVGLPSGVRT